MYDVDKNYEDLKDNVSKYYGQWATDKIIETYFSNQKRGTCIDIGAADGERGSNTKYFEDIGWDALCIEANPECLHNLLEIRKNVIQVACGSVNKAQGNLHIFKVGAKRISSSITSLNVDERLVESHKAIIKERYTRQVEVKTLKDILKTSKPIFQKNIDFISIDTEGTELDVLKGISIKDVNATLYVIENNYNDPEIEIYMRNYGYKKDQRYKINDFYIRGE